MNYINRLPWLPSFLLGLVQATLARNLGHHEAVLPLVSCDATDPVVFQVTITESKAKQNDWQKSEGKFFSLSNANGLVGDNSFI